MDDSQVIAYVLVWIVGFGVISGMVASSKGLNSTNWFVAGALFGIFGLLAAFVATPNTGVVARQQGMKTCPYCAESVKTAAIVCRYCGRDLDKPPPPPPPSSPGTKSSLDQRIEDLQAKAARGQGDLDVMERTASKAMVRWTEGNRTALFRLSVDANGVLQEKRL